MVIILIKEMILYEKNCIFNLFLVMSIIPLYFIFIWSPSKILIVNIMKIVCKVSTKLSNIKRNKVI